MAGETTIDLGELPPAGAADAPPAAGGAWPRFRRRSDRRAAAVAAVTAVLLLTTTAAAPDRPWPAPHFRVPAAGPGTAVYLTGGTLYVTGADRGSITAYRLADGRRRWQVEPAVPSSTVRLVGDVPLLVRYGDAPQDSGEVTHALDPDTGQVRWSAPGLPMATLPGGGVLLREYAGPEPDPDADPGPDPAPQVWSFHTVDRAGATRWRLPSTEVSNSTVDRRDQARRLVTLSPEGELRTYDAATGGRLATATVAVPAPRPVLSVAGDLVLLQPDPDQLVVSAYQLDTLAHRWTAEIDRQQIEPFPTTYRWFADCGPVVCVAGPGDLPGVVDPATGELLWLVDEPPPGEHPGTLAWPGPPWPPDQLLTTGGLVDLETGESTLEFDDWQAVSTGQGEATPIRHPLVSRYDPRYGSDTSVTWLGQVRPEPPRIEVLGRVPSGEQRCEVGTRHLACVDRDRVQVWRLR